MQEDEYRGDFTEPQTLNRYIYVGNNPVMRVDPSGYYMAPAMIDGGSYGSCKFKKSYSASSKRSKIKQKELKLKKKATDIKKAVNSYGSMVNEKKSNHLQNRMLDDDATSLAEYYAKREIEDKINNIVGFVPNGKGETPDFTARQDMENGVIPTEEITGASYDINRMYCAETMQNRSVESIMESLSIWDNFQYIKDNPRQGNPYYLENSYTEEVLYYSIFGEQEEKMDMIIQFALQFDGDETEDKIIEALGMEDNIISNTEPLLEYAARPYMSLDKASDCTAFANNIFSIFNTTDNLVDDSDDFFGMSREAGKQMETSLFEKGNTAYQVGDFVYMDYDSTDEDNFDHVVLIIGIGEKPNEYIVAQASGQKYDFTISRTTFNDDHTIGTINILGETP